MLEPADQEEQERALLRALRKEAVIRARENFLDFCLEMQPDFVVNFHHRIICERLTRLILEMGQRIVITVPPQYGKSQMISRLYPAWVLGKLVNAKIIAASYAAELSVGFNRDCQDFMASPTYKRIFPETKIAPEVRAVRRASEVQTGEKGYYYTTGIGGSTTGRSANPLFIVDDPLKDMEEALSETVRTRVINWFNAVALTRCAMTANVIVMHTRWHAMDLAGYLIDQAETVEGATDWEVINFPAIADPDDRELRMHPEDPRKKGEPLWPEVKGDIPFLNKVKIAVGSAIWNALYQGKPNMDGGNLINPEWFRVYHKLPDNIEQWAISVDCAFKDTKKSDFVAIQCWGRVGADKYLIDQIHGRFGINKTIDMLIEMIIRYPKATAKLIEEKANGSAVIETMQGEVPGVIAICPTDSKESRVIAVSPMVEAGNVWIPHETVARFDISLFRREVSQFPKGKNDDQVDAMTQALEYLSRGENHYLRKLLGRESRDERGRKYPPAERQTGKSRGQQASGNESAV